MKGKILNYTINVRDAVGNIVTQVKFNDVVYGEVYRDNRERIRFSRIYRAAGNIEELGKECNAVTNDGGTLYYMILTNEAEPVPEPPPPDSDIASVRFSGEVVFDYTDGRQEVWHVTDIPFVKGPVV